MYDQADNKVSNPSVAKSSAADTFQELCQKRYKRRDVLRAGAAVGAGFAILGLGGCANREGVEIERAKSNFQSSGLQKTRFEFAEIEHGQDENHHVAADHESQVLIRWGDPLFRDAPAFDPNRQTAETQKSQFGYNNDYVGYLSLTPNDGEQARGILCVNHEYPIAGLMFPNFPADGFKAITKQQLEVTLAAIGNSIVEVYLKDNLWAVDLDSKFNRRITALDTQMRMSGPAAGHPRLSTSADETGELVIGTFNNCAGGMTPWGTYLTCEENFNTHFGGTLDKDNPEYQTLKRYGVPRDYTAWHKLDERFNVAEEPHESNRFGWVVEIDPLDPESMPVKRTALGRFKHEGAESIVAPSGHLVVYMGDDQRFEYLYKFVSRDKVDLDNPQQNRDLLDHGTLYVAKLDVDGSLNWLPLVYENEMLASEFESQAELLIETRRAADLLGATPLDRPEDVVPNKMTGKVYVMLTNNHKRKETDAGSPRTENYFGHIVEIVEHDDDHASDRGRWDMLVQCGNPQNPEHQANWNAQTSENGWFASPDNGVIDPTGRLWVSSDQGSKTNMTGTADGLWALETEGERRGTGKMFFRVPAGAEMCGPVFSDDGESLFLAVQHPGDVGRPGRVRVETAATRWPDFSDDMPPRPSIVVVRKKGGGKVG